MLDITDQVVNQSQLTTLMKMCIRDRQQKDLGIVNGYIEEMMDGQKVVKVFCHEEKSLEQFRILNNRLRESADKANTFSNISMPINANLGNVSYVLCAVTGAILSLIHI